MKGMDVVKVIVKGEIPKRCDDCKFYIADKTFNYCFAVFKNLFDEHINNKRPDWCPLVSIKDLAWMADSNKVLLEIDREAE